MLRELPNLICSHIPMEIFHFYEMGKKQGNQKRVLYVRGCSQTRVFSWGLGTPLGSCCQVLLPQENMLVWELPLQQKGGTPYSSSRHLIHTYLVHKVCNDHEKENHFISTVTKLYLICHLPFNRSFHTIIHSWRWKPPCCFFFFWWCSWNWNHP